MTKPELLAPAGDLEKLKVAITYGADAVYIGGEKFGLRAKAKNFSAKEMEEGIAFAHSAGKKVYVTANIFAHNEDFKDMGKYFKEVESLGVDALIISDPGVFSIAQESVPNMEIHISTQANNTNYVAANFWRKLGAKRIVLARELSFEEISEVRKNIPDDFQLEAFVHGAMCISYSGRCLLSNYLSERDANKGACSHPCRWKYVLSEETRAGEYMPIFEDDRGTYIYNSKDLCLVEYVDKLILSGINSFKIEGRMKTPHYVGTVVSVYREAIDDFIKDSELYNSKKGYYMKEIRKSSHRKFTQGFYFSKPNGNEQIYDSNSYIRTHDFVGIVLDYNNGFAKVEQRNKFLLGDEIEFFRAKNENFTQTIKEMYSEKGEAIDSAPHPKQILKIKTDFPVEKFDILRKKVE